MYKEVPEHPIHVSLGAIKAPTTFSSLLLPWDAEYARGAWLIPIRGSPIHPSATPGQLLLSASPPQTSARLSSDSVTFPDPFTISWTPKGLRQFWNFLILMRTKGVFGPMAIFLEVEGLVPSLSVAVRKADTGKVNSVQSSHHSCLPQKGAREWIRVVCDGTRALRIRTVLECFKVFEQTDITVAPKLSKNGRPATDKQSQARGQKRTRGSRAVIRGSLLVYTDDLGRPILVA